MLMLTNKYLNTAARRSLIFSDLTSWLEQSLCPPLLFVNIHPHNCGVCGCVCSITATSLYRRVSCTNYNDNEIRCWGPAAKLRENTIPCPWLMVHLSMTPCIKIPFPWISPWLTSLGSSRQISCTWAWLPESGFQVAITSILNDWPACSHLLSLKHLKRHWPL